MTNVVYPLIQVLDVKKRRVEKQEKVVQEKREALEAEERKLEERIQERNKVQEHYDAKLQQLRDELDEGTTTDKIQQMKAYLKVVQERLKVEEKKVEEQREQVKIAEQDLELAIEELRRRRQDVDKLLTHQRDWEKEMKKEQEVIEGREQDEMGTIIFSKIKREGLH
ncbi:MAG: type III secretion T3S chaperone [Chlamydiales bacterium]|nr:type III secretion T3S chaperone [Chlamydiia bacterium]MCP5507015.1 type III secretion T3S chaperone [Chlamydiales bacterium]